MSDSYERLLEGNRIFVARKNHEDPTFFQRLSTGQKPKYLWIGCADSRVPNDQITSTNPGEIFTTRNIANLVDHTDMSMLSVLDYAVNHLKVDHIIVCGHYSCGGVHAAMSTIEEMPTTPNMRKATQAQMKSVDDVHNWVKVAIGVILSDSA